MLGSYTARAAWISPRELAVRLAVASVLILGVMHLLQRPAAEALIPVFRMAIQLLTDSFVINDARIAEHGASDTVRFRANLARPITLDGRTIYPFGWNGAPEGGFQVTYTVGGVWSYIALMLIVVFACPGLRAKEYELRLLLSVVPVAVLLLLDVPTTVLAELWNGIYDWADIHRLSGWVIWSRFLMGGGGYLIALLMAAGVLVWARSLSMPRPRWREISAHEFDAFLREYPGAFRVEPPWGRPVRRHTVWSMSPRGQRAGPIAERRRTASGTRYRVREDKRGPPRPIE